jgi:hypothetical protein
MMPPSPFAALHRQVGEEQMVIDDDDVALLRLLMHPRDEAALELRALLAGAQIAARVHLGPRAARFGQRLDLGAVADFGGLLPLANDLKIGDLFQAFSTGSFRRRRSSGGRRNWRGPSCSRRAAAAEMLFRKRNVLEEKLLLQILRAGGNDDARPERIAGTR